MKTIKVGDRIRLLKMDNDPNPILVGDCGEVTKVNEIKSFEEIQVSVKWDSGRTLMVLLPHDIIEVIE
jgi:hypothetical protein